jgi:hypothetical protein
MSVQLKPPSSHRIERALEALFREARRLERRRRQRYVAVGLVASLVAGAAAYLITDTGGRSPRTSGRPFSVAVSSITLPHAGDYFSLAVVGGHLIVSGGPQGSLFPSDSITSMSHGRPSGTCDSATADPVTLRLSRFARGNCGDPALYHEGVLPIDYEYRGQRPGGGTLTMGIRIATADPAAPDGYTLGPVVATYPQCSDCGPQWIYGDGSLWIYDQFVGPGFAQKGELLRISESTGAVAQRWPMPSIGRPLVAVNADGFWLAPSNESGWPEHTPPSQLIRYQSLYHVWPGAHAPARVLPVGGGGGALWLVASGHTVWLEANRDPKLATLWRLTGISAEPTLLGSYAPNSTQGGEYGAGAPTYAGNAAIGIYYVLDPNDYTVNSRTRQVVRPQQVIRLVPNAPIQHKVATVQSPTSELYAPPPPAVALGRSFYFLDPPTLSYDGGIAAPVVEGTGVLFRVTPRTRL